MKVKMERCHICPRGCLVNRSQNAGFCNEKSQIRIAKIIEHFKWEEPCLADDRGTLAIFFSGCNLRCDYCQNYEISRGGVGKVYSVGEFCELISEKQKTHSSIDLITPTHFSKELTTAFKKIKKTVPVIWNTNSYETLENIKMISSFVDVFLADFKYSDNDLGQKFSKCNNYFSVAIDTIKLMCQLKPDIFVDKDVTYKNTKKISNDKETSITQTKDESNAVIENKNNSYTDNILMKQGVIIRHLVLPGYVENSIKVLDAIKQHFPIRKISLMSQFTPNGKSTLNRKLNPIEYKLVVAHLQKLGLENGYIQDFESAQQCFVPNFR